MAFDANMSQTPSRKEKGLDKRNMIIRVPAADVYTCTSKGPDGMEVERMYDSVVGCKGLRSKIREVGTVEDDGSKIAQASEV